MTDFQKFVTNLQRSVANWLPVCTNTMLKGSAQVVDPGGTAAGNCAGGHAGVLLNAPAFVRRFSVTLLGFIVTLPCFSVAELGRKMGKDMRFWPGRQGMNAKSEVKGIISRPIHPSRFQKNVEFFCPLFHCCGHIQVKGDDVGWHGNMPRAQKKAGQIRRFGTSLNRTP